MDDYFDITGTSPDTFLALLMGGMARAQDRFRAKLNTVDAEGNPIDTTKTTGVDTLPPFGRLE